MKRPCDYILQAFLGCVLLYFSTNISLLPWLSEGRVLNKVSGSLLSSKARDRGLLSSKRTYSKGDKTTMKHSCFFFNQKMVIKTDNHPSECKATISSSPEKSRNKGATDRGHCSQTWSWWIGAFRCAWMYRRLQGVGGNCRRPLRSFVYACVLV